jgi:hypothetical protein
MLPDTGADRAVPPPIDELSTYPPSAAANPVMFVKIESTAFLAIRKSMVAVRTIWGAIGNVGTRGSAPLPGVGEVAVLPADGTTPAEATEPGEPAETAGLDGLDELAGTVVVGVAANPWSALVVRDDPLSAEPSWGVAAVELVLDAPDPLRR